MRTKIVISILCLGIGLIIGLGLQANKHSTATAATKANIMTTEETKALVEQFNAAWVKNDDLAMTPLAAAHIAQGYPPHEDMHKGRKAVVAYLTGKSGSTADSILKVDTMVQIVHKLVVEGNTAVAFHHMSAELADGGDYANEYVWRYTCADGKVTRLDGYVDTLHVIKQIGNHPALPPTQ